MLAMREAWDMTERRSIERLAPSKKIRSVEAALAAHDPRAQVLYSYVRKYSTVRV